MRKPNKLEKEIFAMIYAQKGKRALEWPEFYSAYIGALMFIFHDRYGLPLNLMKEITERKLCQSEGS